MQNIRKIIRRMLPLGLMLKRTRNRFMDELYAWKASGKDFEWDTESRFESIVSVDSFGATGASAVQDLFREYEGNAILGTVDTAGNSLASSDEHVGEIDFMRHTGGLLQLLQCFDRSVPKSQFWDDATMKLFLDEVYYSEFFRKCPKVRPCFYKFVDELIAIHTRGIDGHLYNPTLGKLDDKSEIFVLRDLSREAFLALSRKFICTLFNLFYKEGVRNILLDQLFSDCGNNMLLFKEFVPNLKRIVVYRDPRDVYCIAHKFDLKWMPHDKVEDYIQWVKLVYNDFDKNATDYLPVRFEALVEDYEDTVRRIETYLNVDSRQHVRPRSCFDPEVSKVSVREWARQAAFSKAFQEIEMAFPTLCYE